MPASTGMRVKTFGERLFLKVINCSEKKNLA